MYFIGNQKFRPESSKGIVAEMEKVLDSHSYFLENIKAGAGVVITKNAEGGITIDSYGGGNGAADNGVYGFKVVATPTASGTWATSGTMEFNVSIYNGTAQTFGGDVWELCEPPEQVLEYANPVEDGSWIVVQYEAYNSGTFEEIGEWNYDVLETLPTSGAPQKLTFPIAQVGSSYNNYVNQMHKGAIVMPAISNIVDLQGQIVQAQ